MSGPLTRARAGLLGSIPRWCVDPLVAPSFEFSFHVAAVVVDLVEGDVPDALGVIDSLV